ncbi:MAG: hypothetical protein K5622_07370 [Endomicrobiaceae bacterium]|nr:hypothetical protein [Endomicrobiaceae bacterium]
MKKLSAVAMALLLCVSVSFAARGGTSNSGSSSNKASSSSSSQSSGNFGLGYSKRSYEVNIGNVGTVTFDQIAGRYWFNDSFALDVKLGFGSGDLTSRVLVGANIVGKIVSINKLNVYWLAGLDFGNYKLKGQNGAQDIDNSIFGFQGGLGAELFVLPCLSVLTEMGIRYTSVKPDIQGANSVTDFGIFADWLPQAGVRFYF